MSQRNRPALPSPGPFYTFKESVELEGPDGSSPTLWAPVLDVARFVEIAADVTVPAASDEPYWPFFPLFEGDRLYADTHPEALVLKQTHRASANSGYTRDPVVEALMVARVSGNDGPSIHMVRDGEDPLAQRIRIVRWYWDAWNDRSRRGLPSTVTRAQELVVRARGELATSLGAVYDAKGGGRIAKGHPVRLLARLKALEAFARTGRRDRIEHSTFQTLVEHNVSNYRARGIINALAEAVAYNPPRPTCPDERPRPLPWEVLIEKEDTPVAAVTTASFYAWAVRVTKWNQKYVRRALEGDPTTQATFRPNGASKLIKRQGMMGGNYPAVIEALRAYGLQTTRVREGRPMRRESTWARQGEDLRRAEKGRFPEGSGPGWGIDWT